MTGRIEEKTSSGTKPKELQEADDPNNTAHHPEPGSSGIILQTDPVLG
jgi:hypothetical protein